MMQRQVLKVFLSRIRSLDSTRRRIEELYDRRQVVRRDVESVYEGLFIRSVTAFESFLENLFYAIVCRQTSFPLRKVRAIVNVPRRSDVAAILFEAHGRSYCEWLPYEHTETRAKAMLVGGRPFTGIYDSQKSTLKKIMVTRNAIAHASPHAHDKYKRVVLSQVSLPPRDRSPASYLRAVARNSPRMTYYEIFVSEMTVIANSMVM